MQDSRLKRIGVAAPLSGRGGTLGRELVQAASLAIAEANAAGNAPVRFEAVIGDDAGDEHIGGNIARRFIDDPTLVGVIGHYNSNVTLPVAARYDEAGLALVAPIVSNPKLTESGWRNVFRFTNRDDLTATALAIHLTEALSKRCAAVIAARTVYGRSMADEFTRAFSRMHGRVVRSDAVDEGETRFDNWVEGLPNEIDLVFYGGTFEGAPIVKALRAHGKDVLFAAGDGCWDIVNFLRPAGAAAMEGEGVLILSACAELGRVPGSSEFAERYRQRYAEIINYAVNSYDATRLLLSAIARCADSEPTTRAAVAEAIRTSVYRGIAYADEVRWDSKGDNRAAGTALHVVSDGEYRQIAHYPAAKRL
jgi:branched-chain amino acid transport system substrate-binding protein